MSENFPTDWQKISLGEIGCFSTSSVDKLIEANEYPVKLINYMDVYRHNRLNHSIEFMDVTASSIEKIKSQVLMGDIIFTPSSETPDDIGYSAVVEDNMNCILHSYHTVRLRPSEKTSLNVIFSSWFLNAEYVRNQFARKCAGSTRYTLSLPAFKSTFCVLPCNIYEQQKIATILTSIDTAIKKTEALIHKCQQIKAGLMHDLFTRGVTADGKLRPPREQVPELYQETLIGWIPKDWSINSFGEQISIIDPNPSHRYPLEVDDGVPLCSTENFVGEDDFTLDKAKLVAIDTFSQQNNRCGFFIDDVIFARKGKIGLARRYGVKKKAFSHTVVIFKARSQQISSKWLLWLSRSDWLLKAIDVTMNSNSGVPTLGVGFIGKIEVPFPSIEEQRLAAINLDAIALRICRENQSLAKLQLQKKGLMQDLLTGKVRVKLDQPETANV